MGKKNPPVSGKNIAKDFNQEHRKFETGKLKKFTAKEKAEFYDAIEKRILQTEAGYSNSFAIVLNEAGRPIALRLGFPRGLESIKAMKNDSENLKLFKFLNSTQTVEENYIPVRYRAGSETFKVKQFLTGFFFEDWPNMPLDKLADAQEFYYIDWEDIILPIELIDNFKYANERIKRIWRAEIRKALFEYKNGSVQRDQIVHFIEPLEEDFNLTNQEVNRIIARLIPLLNVAEVQMNDESETEIFSNENETDIEDSEENERGEIEKSTDETEENEMNKQLQNKSLEKSSNETEKTRGEVKKGDQISGKNKTTKQNKTKTKKPNRKSVEILKKSLESFSTTNETIKSTNKRFLSNENETQSSKVVKRNDIKDVSNSKQITLLKESKTEINGINENKSYTSQKANSKQQIQNDSENQTDVNVNEYFKKSTFESSIESETDHESIPTVVNTKNTLKRSLVSDSELMATDKANGNIKKMKSSSRKVKSNKPTKRTNKSNEKNQKSISKQTINQTQNEKPLAKDTLDQKLQKKQLDSKLNLKTDYQMDNIDDVASSKTEKSIKSVSVVIETDKSENKNFDFEKDESENIKIKAKENIENETNLKQTITENKSEINQNDEEKLENDICKVSVQSKDISKIIDVNENPTQSCEDENLKMELQGSLKSIGEVNEESSKQMDDSFASNSEIFEVEPESNHETIENFENVTESESSDNLNQENDSQGTASNESLEMQNQMAAGPSQISTIETKTESNPIPKPFKIPKLSNRKSNTVTNILSDGQPSSSSSSSASSSSIDHDNVDQTADKTANQTQPMSISVGFKTQMDKYFDTLLTEQKENSPIRSVSIHKPAFGHNKLSSTGSTTRKSSASKYPKSRGSHSKERYWIKETDSKHVSSGASSKMTVSGQISSEKSPSDTNQQNINDRKGKNKRNYIRNSEQYTNYYKCLFRPENPNPERKEKNEIEIDKPNLAQMAKSNQTNKNKIKALESLHLHSTTIPLSTTTSNDSSNSEVKLPKLGMMLKGKNDTKLANDEICSKTSCNKTKIATSISDSAISSSKTDETVVTNEPSVQSFVSSTLPKMPKPLPNEAHKQLTDFSRNCRRLLVEELKKHRSLVLTMVHYECELNNKKRYYVLVEVHYIDLYKNHPVIVRTLCFESVPNFDLVTIRSMFDKFMKDPKFELRKKYLIVLADDVLSAAIPRKYQLHRDEIEALLCYLNPNEYQKWYHSTRDNSCQSFERQNPMLNVGKVLEGYRKPNSSMDIREYKFRNEYESQMKQYKKQIEILEQYPNLTIFNDSPTAFMHRNYPKLFEASIFFKSLRGSFHRIEIIKQRLIQHCPKAESMINYGNLPRKLLSDWMFITLNRGIKELVDLNVYSTCYHLVNEKKQHRSKLNNSNYPQ